MKDCDNARRQTPGQHPPSHRGKASFPWLGAQGPSRNKENNISIIYSCMEIKVLAVLWKTPSYDTPQAQLQSCKAQFLYL